MLKKKRLTHREELKREEEVFPNSTLPKNGVVISNQISPYLVLIKPRNRNTY
jgi:hypothetical protein